MSTMPPKDLRWDQEKLLVFAAGCLMKLGMDEAAARTVADVLLEADIRDKRSHGIIRLPHYVRRLRAGSIKAQPQMRVTPLAPAALLLDADDGMGHVAGKLGMRKAVETARETGVCAVSIVNSSHFGIAGFFSEIAADAGMVGIAMTHTDANTVPFGANTPFFGTNAIGFSVPSNEPHHLSVDFCTSTISFGKIYQAALTGTALPQGAAMDKDGQPTTDPDRAEFLTFAGAHKGYGLGIIIETLCALLTGIPYGPHINSMYDDLTQPRKLGQFLLAIDISRFQPLENFRATASRMIAELHGLTPNAGAEGVKVHGELGHKAKLEHLRSGLPLNAKLAAELATLGQELGVPLPASLD